MVAEALVVGDLHAMSVEVEVGRFMRFLDKNPAKTLVLAGDTLDFYIWRHARGRVDVAAGLEVVRFLDGVAEKGVEIVVIPGNHDMEWMWLVGGAVPKRYVKHHGYPEGMKELLEALVARPNVRVVNELDVGGTMIVHGHEGWQGDWLWRMSELGDRATRYRLVGGSTRRTVMGGVPNSFRAAAVRGHGFYRRLATWAKKRGMKQVIHGHTHVEGRRVVSGVVLDCLPTWRPREGNGGGLIYEGGVWRAVAAD